MESMSASTAVFAAEPISFGYVFSVCGSRKPLPTITKEGCAHLQCFGNYCVLLCSKQQGVLIVEAPEQMPG